MNDVLTAKVLGLCSSNNFMFVGGVVRDFARKLLSSSSNIQQKGSSVFLFPSEKLPAFLSSVSDIDISSLLYPKTVGKILDDLFPSAQRKRNFATNSIVVDGIKIEITSTRIDEECDGKNAKMVHGVSYFRDSFRRDFTFNAMYMQSNGLVFDFHNGMESIKNNEINFIGNTSERLMEDFTRIKRYYNFCERFSLQNKAIEKEIDYITKSAKIPIIMR